MFFKVLFSRPGHGTTAGLVVDGAQRDVLDMSAVSRLYPASEARYMRRYHVSQPYQTQAEALRHVFALDVLGRPQGAK